MVATDNLECYSTNMSSRDKKTWVIRIETRTTQLLEVEIDPETNRISDTGYSKALDTAYMTALTGETNDGRLLEDVPALTNHYVDIVGMTSPSFFYARRYNSDKSENILVIETPNTNHYEFPEISEEFITNACKDVGIEITSEWGGSKGASGVSFVSKNKLTQENIDDLNEALKPLVPVSRVGVVIDRHLKNLKNQAKKQV